MKLPRVEVLPPSREDLAVLQQRAEALAHPEAGEAVQGEGGLHVSFSTAGLRVALAEPHVVRMVPRIGALHPVPGSGLHLSWIDMRPLVVVDLAEAFGVPREPQALASAPGLILRAAPAVVVAVSGPLDLTDGAVAQDAGRGAWPHAQATVLGRLADGAFVLADGWLQEWVNARASREA